MVAGQGAKAPEAAAPAQPTRAKDKYSLAGFVEKIIGTFAQTALGVLITAGAASAAMTHGMIPWQSAVVQGLFAAGAAVLTSFGTLLLSDKVNPGVHALILGAVTWAQSLFGTWAASETDSSHVHFVFATAAYSALVAAVLAVLKALAGLANPTTEGASVVVPKKVNPVSAIDDPA